MDEATFAPAPYGAALKEALRLFTILRLTAVRRPDRPVTRTYLAEACECCTKTIQRDIQTLQSAYIPITYDAALRTYVLPEEYGALSLKTLTAADALALALLRGFLSDTLTALPFAREIETALDKAASGLRPPLMDLMKNLTPLLTEHGGLARDYSRAPIRAVLAALAGRQTLEILYDSRSSGACNWRRIDPYRLGRQDGRYLQLEAWCHNHHDVRAFAVDRIRDVRLTDQKFVPRDWKPSDDGVVGGMRSSRWVDVEVRFSPVVAHYARERRWPFKASMEDTKDGGVILRGRVQGVDGMVRELLSWQRYAEVLGGPELRTRMAEEVRAMATLYAD